jgi:hypothetical protein
MVNQQQVASQQGQKQQVVSRPKGRHQHWVRRSGYAFVMVFSIFFAIISGSSIGWYYSTLDSVSQYQWIITDLIAVAFSGFGFFLSRALAYCVHHKDVPKGFKTVVVLGVVFYEVVELASCFSEAAFGVHKGMTWLSEPGFDPVLSFVLHVLPFLVLPIFPVFTILCGQLDIVFDLQGDGQSVQFPAVQQPIAGSASVSAQYKSAPTVLAGMSRSPQPYQFKSAMGSPSVPPTQNGQRYPSRGPVLPSQVPLPASVDPNGTRQLPESLQHDLHLMEPALTGATAQRFMPSDDPTLVTEQQVPGQSKGGWGWLSPFSGRKQNDVRSTEVLQSEVMSNGKL